jgi:hypothetical protein
MSDRKNKSKMADKVVIEQFGADHQLYCNMTSNRKEKRKCPRFAFLIIPANPQMAHLVLPLLKANPLAKPKEPFLVHSLIKQSIFCN